MAIPKCGSLKKSGGYCGRPAGWGTNHVGQGKCKLHGGKSKVKHGLYSKINHPRLAELREQAAQIENPTDLLEELAMLRALVADYIERHSRVTDALLAWHESFHTSEGEPKPRQLPDIISVGTFIGMIGNLAERIEKRKAAGSISLATMDRTIEQLGAELVAAAAETIPDEAMRTKFLEAVERRWGSMRLVEQ